MIQFHSEGVDFELFNKNKIEQWLSSSISAEGKTLGEINVVFCNDKYLLELNQNYLNHDTYTDIITFDYVVDKQISGDLFISIERVRENANTLNLKLEDELSRVLIHGVLHLLGYQDKTSKEALEIRAKEDFYLALQSN